MTRRTLAVNALARVEGEGGMFVEVREGQVQSVTLDIFEPPRFFEALLRGRDFSEAPDITARICGICPVAYQMSSCHALEKALGIQPGPEIRTLRACCTAASGSRVMRCISICCTRRTSWATKAA